MLQALLQIELFFRFIYRFTYIVAHILVIKAYPLCSFVSLRTSLFQGISLCSYTKNSSSVGNYTLRSLLCSRMETVISVLALKILKTGNELAFLITYRITLTCKNNAYGCLIFKLKINLIELSIDTCIKYIYDISLESRENNLPSGSPNLALYSRTLGPSCVSISPKKITPLNSLPSDFMASTVA